MIQIASCEWALRIIRYQYKLQVYGKALSHLFDKHILLLINLIYRFDNIGLSKMTHLVRQTIKLLVRLYQ